MLWAAQTSDLHQPGLQAAQRQRRQPAQRASPASRRLGGLEWSGHLFTLSRESPLRPRWSLGSPQGPWAPQPGEALQWRDLPFSQIMQMRGRLGQRLHRDTGVGATNVHARNAWHSVRTHDSRFPRLPTLRLIPVQCQSTYREAKFAAQTGCPGKRIHSVTEIQRGGGGGGVSGPATRPHPIALVQVQRRVKPPLPSPFGLVRPPQHSKKFPEAVTQSARTHTHMRGTGERHLTGVAWMRPFDHLPRQRAAPRRQSRPRAWSPRRRAHRRGQGILIST